MKKLIRSVLALSLLISAAVVTSSALSAEKGAERLKSKISSKPPPKADKEKKPEPPKDEEKPFDEVIKDTEVIKGLFTFYRKADENRLLMEVLPDPLDK